MNDTNKNNDKEGEDAEQMRLAFETFMLTGKKQPTNTEENNDDTATLSSNKSKKKKKKKKKSSLGGTPPKPPSTPSKANSGKQHMATPSSSISSSSLKQSTMAKSDKKRYYQLLRSFNDKVQHTWIDIDNQILSILQNIVSIRRRLPLEWKLLHSSTHNLKGDPEEEDDDENNQDDEWKHYGFLGKPKEIPYSFHLHTTDVELALTNDLTQHEKMLVGIRSLMSNLAECHDGLGRVVDNLWKFHLECCAVKTAGNVTQDEDDDEEEGRQCDDGWVIDNDMEHIVQSVTAIFQMLSLEMYRKQNLVPLIIESTEDEILGVERQTTDVGGHGAGNALGGSSGGSTGNGTGSGLQTARKCCQSWQRNSQESCVDESLISHVLKLGEVPQPAK